MKHYSFVTEADQINLENPSENNGFQPLIKDKSDIPLSNDQADKLETVAKIRQIEAKTKELEAKAKVAEMQAQGGDPSMMGAGGGIDPTTGMPMTGGGIDPMTGMPMPGGGIDPATGMPMDPSMMGQDGNDPLAGLGDKSAPPDPMGGMDPMTGMPSGGSQTPYTAIGRAYKLKEIFEKLNKIKNYLRDSTDDDLGKLYHDADKSFEMYKLLINNLKTYKEKVDDLIIMYYELIKIMLEKIQNTLNEKSSD